MSTMFIFHLHHVCFPVVRLEVGLSSSVYIYHGQEMIYMEIHVHDSTSKCSKSDKRDNMQSTRCILGKWERTHIVLQLENNHIHVHDDMWKLYA